LAGGVSSSVTLPSGSQRFAATSVYLRMAESSRRPPQWTLVSLLVIVIVMAVLVCLAMPAAWRAKRAQNERGAVAMMKMLATAQADFRGNDRDNDRVQNFWVYDVSGLYTLCPSTNGSSVPVPDSNRTMRLILPWVAAADVTDVDHDAPGTVPMAEAFSGWSPRSGYVFRAFAAYDVGRRDAWGELLPESRLVRYGGVGGIEAWGETRNAAKFAFAALPGRSDVGSQVFVMDEAITVYGLAVDGDYEATYDRGGPRARFTWRGVSTIGRPFTPATPLPDTPWLGRMID